jgi:hypothetical protein
MTDKAMHEVELNFYYLHYNDCKKFVKLAKNEQTKLKSIYVRHAILQLGGVGPREQLENKEKR